MTARSPKIAIAIEYQAPDQVVRSYRSSPVIARQQRSGNIKQRYGAEFLSMHRADLLDIFTGDLPSESVHLDADCVDTETRGDVAVARFADGGEIEADIVIGVDGIHSAVRDSLLGPIEPTFTGCICWRGMAPIDAVSHMSDALDMTAWWGPHGHVVHYPVRRGDLVNFVAHFDSDGWTGESWNHECDRSELMDTYGEWNESLLRLIKSSDRYYKWALFDRDQRPARFAAPRQANPPGVARRAAETRYRHEAARPLRQGQIAEPGRLALRLRLVGGRRLFDA